MRRPARYRAAVALLGVVWAMSACANLERFPKKWEPVFRPGSAQDIESRAFLVRQGDSALPGKALAPGRAAARIQPPPPTLAVSSFYRKHVDAGGIPIISSKKVPDKALLIARGIVNAMLPRRPDIRQELVKMGAYIGVIASSEGTADMPEMRQWTKPAPDDPRLTRCEKQFYHQIAAMSDRDYWNVRTRGMGGTFTTVGAENLLGVPGTRYFGENIFVHEFSHNILNAIERVDPALFERVQKAYDQAMAKGLWKYSYSAVTVQEYWAEGTQFWFNSNMIFKSGTATVLSSDDLKNYDPLLFAVLAEVYSDHRVAADVFYMHPARLNAAPIPKDGVCKSMFGALDPVSGARPRHAAV